jgi:ABC-2 type transport system ATP-binding protein
MSDVVKLSGVTKRFGDKVAVNAIDLRVREGSITGFLGPNGSGKTTTLRLIIRLYAPDEGTVEVLGSTDEGCASDQIGYLPEERGLYRSMRVRDLLGFFARLKGVRSPEGAVQDWLARLDLADAANLKVEALSKGMSQRVQFIAAVVHRPRLVILDEPFSGLDPVHAAQIGEAVRELKREGATVILSTHDMDVAQRMCDSLVLIHHGNKVLDGSWDEVRRRHGRVTVRTRLSGVAIDASRLPGVEDAVDLGAEMALTLRPEADAQAVLEGLMKQGPVASFELGESSLREIFLESVGASRMEKASA